MIDERVGPHKTPDRTEWDRKVASAGAGTEDPMQPDYGDDTVSVKADGGGLRNNTYKLRLDLTPPEWLWALAEVTTRGSLKYAERNWERGMKWSIMIGCATRHTLKFICGERYDRETGCHHLAMASWNLLALMSYDIREIGSDDIRTITSLATLEATTGCTIESVALRIERDRKSALDPDQMGGLHG